MISPLAVPAGHQNSLMTLNVSLQFLSLSEYIYSLLGIVTTKSAYVWKRGRVKFLFCTKWITYFCFILSVLELFKASFRGKSDCFFKFCRSKMYFYGKVELTKQLGKIVQSYFYLKSAWRRQALLCVVSLPAPKRQLGWRIKPSSGRVLCVGKPLLTHSSVWRGLGSIFWVIDEEI